MFVTTGYHHTRFIRNWVAVVCDPYRVLLQALIHAGHQIAFLLLFIFVESPKNTLKLYKLA